MPEDPEILRLLARFRAALLRQDEAALQAIIDAYRLMYDRLGGRIDALIQAAGAVEGLTPAGLRRLSQYAALETQLIDELRRFSIFLDTHINTAARAALNRGDADMFNILRFLIGDTRAVLRANFARLPVEAINTMIGFLQPGSPLHTAIDTLAGFRANRVMQGLIDAIGLGDSPRTTARLLASAFEAELGRGLVDALRIARTAQLYAYREAGRANMQLNSDVVTGWVWVADLEGDPSPCMSCLAMHGTEHALDENLDDHDNGRCAAIPMVLGVNPVEGMEGGETWFTAQPEDRQRDIMGPGRYDAWREGQFDFAALSRTQDHPTWGHVRSETPLKDLIGESE